MALFTPSIPMTTTHPTQILVFGGACDLSGSTSTFRESSAFSVASLIDATSGTARPLQLQTPRPAAANTGGAGLTRITPSMWAQRMSHSATLLPGGGVLILGGCGLDVRPEFTLPDSETDSSIPLMLLVDASNGRVTCPEWKSLRAAPDDGTKGHAKNSTGGKESSDSVILVRHSSVLGPH